jgi:uncharacterized membrane protein YiaA
MIKTKLVFLLGVVVFVIGPYAAEVIIMER